MIEFLTTAVLLVGCLTALNLVLLFAVIRRLRQAEAMGPKVGTQLPDVGRRVGSFVVATYDSAQVTDLDLAVGTTIIGFVMPGCGPCQDLIDEIKGERGTDSPIVLFVVGAGDEAVRYAEALTPLARVAMVPDENQVATALGGITGYPTLVRVHDGVVVAAGRSLASVVDRTALAGNRA